MEEAGFLYLLAADVKRQSPRLENGDRMPRGTRPNDRTPVAWGTVTLYHCQCRPGECCLRGSMYPILTSEEAMAARIWNFVLYFRQLYDG